jgi:lipopolysaccharide export system permease protein
MIIRKKIIVNNWFKYFFQINFILFILILSANSISGLLRSNVTSFEIALNQLFTMPDILLKTIPISCLLTSIILVSKLISTSELTAMYSLGFSPTDFMYTIIKLSLGTFLCTLIISGFIQPSLIKVKSDKFTFLEKKFRKLKKQGLISSKASNGKMWYKSGKYFFNYATYNQQNNELTNIESFKIQDSKTTEALFSDSLLITNNSKWRGKVINKVLSINSNTFNREHIVNGPMEVIIPLEKKEIKNLEQDILSLNIIKFKQYIDQLEKDGVSSTRYRVTYWQKVSISMSCIIFSLIGLLGLNNSNKRSQSIGASIGITFVIVLSYWFLDSLFIELGKNSKINIYISTFGSLLVAVALLTSIRLKQIIKDF